MFNRYSARCVECGALVPPGKGVVLCVEGTKKKPVWQVKCNKHINWNQIPKQYRPREEQT